MFSASNGENKSKKSSNKPLPVPASNGQHQSAADQTSSPQVSSAHFYVAGNANGMHTVSPQYEQLQPVPIEYSPQASQQYASNVQQPHYNHPGFMASDHLEMWDQIKSRVDDPYLATRDDTTELDVARIAADLKAEFEVQQPSTASIARKYSTSNGGDLRSSTSDPKGKLVDDPMLCENSEESER